MLHTGTTETRAITIPQTAAAILAVFAGTCFIASAQPFENVVSNPIVTLPPLDYRAVATIAVGSSSTRTYAAVGCHPVPGNTSSFLHLATWSESGTSSGFIALNMPHSNGWFDIRSISEAPNGEFLVGGYAGDSAITPRTFWATFNSNLTLKSAWVYAGSDTSDPRMKAIVLSSGNIVIMDPIYTGSTTRPRTRMVCFDPNGNTVWAHAYTTNSCETLRFSDLRESASGLLYAAGYVQGAFFPTACIMEIDPTPITGNGVANRLWKYPASVGAGSEFTGIDFDSSGDVLACGTITWLAFPGPGFVYYPRATRISFSSNMAPTLDRQYNTDLIPAFGTGRRVPPTFGGTWAMLDQFFIAGSTVSGKTARHLRVDGYTLGVIAGSEFGGGSPVETRFSGLTIGSAQPAEAVMVGLRRSSSAATDEAYVAKTGAFGATACSTPFTTSTTSLTPAYQALVPVTQSMYQDCNGNSIQPIFAVTQINLPDYVFSASVVFHKRCEHCTGDLNGDTTVDDADFVMFAAEYDQLVCDSPNMAPGCPADFNIDGFVDDQDFVLFAAAYDQLVCD